jgi:hypothetical protein
MTTAWMQEVEQRRSSCQGRFGFGFGFGAHDARYRGPLGRGEAAQEKSEGWPTRCGPVRCQSRDGLSANPGAASRTRSTGTVRRARVWGALSFGYFSLSTQRKVTRSPEASEHSAGMPRDEGACLGSRKSLGPCLRRGDGFKCRTAFKSIAPEGAPTVKPKRFPRQEASENRQGCRATKARALEAESHWAPACAGVTRGRETSENLAGVPK